MQDLSMYLEQKQAISQKTIQNIEILQMNAQELESYLNNIALENPVIDSDRNTEESESIIIQSESAYSTDFNFVRKKNEQQAPGNAYEYLTASPDNSLNNSIYLQLIPFFHNEKDKSILYFLTESLDDNGFLTLTIEDLCRIFHISEKSALEYIHILQSVEPAGIGASSLNECLILQLERMDCSDKELAKTILTFYLTDIANNKLKELAKKLNVSLSKVYDAINLIKTLNPKPGNGYCNNERPVYLQPDVIIMQKHNNFQITINGDLAPGMKINENYRQLLNHPDSSVREYLYQKFQQAEWINKCLKQRNSTLLKITRQLIINQKEFFMHGPDHLKPFTQSDLSELLKVNSSTISRAIRNKYLECFWGTFPFKYFFTKPVPSEVSDSTVDSVKSFIQKLINAEDKKHPLSDQKISDLLSAEGFHIARRTVSKYRMALSIPDTSKRRVY